jgi:hypothetical protein
MTNYTDIYVGCKNVSHCFEETEDATHTRSPATLQNTHTGTEEASNEKHGLRTDRMHMEELRPDRPSLEVLHGGKHVYKMCGF